MTHPIEYLDLEDVLALATRLLGDPPPIRLLEVVSVGVLLAWVAISSTLPR